MMRPSRAPGSYDADVTDSARILEPSREGWADYQRLLMGAIEPLTVEQLS
jgi:hypothetical protein